MATVDNLEVKIHASATQAVNAVDKLSNKLGTLSKTLQGIDSNGIDKSIKTISDEVAEVKKSVSDRNTKIATAITEKGVATEPTDSADVMAENIGKIATGMNLGQNVKSTTTTSGNTEIKTLVTYQEVLEEG